MGSKRKSEEVASSSKRTTPATPIASGPPQKKQRKDDAKPTSDKKTTKPELSEPPKTPQVSIIQEEERSFPRGGGGVLTPLEHKQIQIQATRDALFEESGRKRLREDGAPEDDGSGEEHDVPAKVVKKKKSSKSKTKSTPKDAVTDTRIRADGLKFKTLVPGLLVLGQISAVLDNELVLDLPNNLTGHVSIANISSTLTDRLMSLGQDEGDDRDAMADGEDIILQDLFRVGQYLRASVLSSTEASEKAKSKKRIELSIDPKTTNGRLATSEISADCMVQASVSSVEDHGLIMDLGLESDTGSKGFMSSKEIPSGVEYSSIKEGAVYTCLVTGMSSNGKVIKLSANQEKAGDLRKANVLTDPGYYNALLPGTAVELLVSQISSTSIAGHLMGTVNAGADIVHCGAAFRKDDIESKYKIGDKVKARILFTHPSADARIIGLTFLDHVLALSSKSTKEGKTQRDPLEKLPIGTIVEKAKVITVESGLGVFVDIGNREVAAFVHVSRMSENRIEPPSQTTGPYRSGTSHRARIIGYNKTDGMYLASFEKSVLEQKYLRVEDIPVGAVVTGIVEKLVVQKSGSSGVIVDLAKGISGLVPELHLADVHLQHPERKFKEGLEVTARVLSTDLERHQIRLTLKKSLVKMEGKPWTIYDDVEVGMESQGTIVTLDARGALVQFFGNVRGFLPVSEMSDTFVEDAKTRFRVGQVVTVHAKSVDPSDERMTLSCRSHSVENDQGAAAAAGLKYGQLVSGTVAEKSTDSVIVELTEPSIKATLPLAHMTDGTTKKSESAFKQIRVGQTLHDLVVVEIFSKRQAVTVSNKPSFVRLAKEAVILSDLNQLDEEMQLDGFIRNVTDDGVFLQTNGGLTGFLHRNQMTPDRLQLPDFGLAKGHSLKARVTSIDLRQERFTLSLKPSDKDQEQEKPSKPAAAPHAVIGAVDGSSSSLDDYPIGKLTMAQVTSVKDTQLNVQLAGNVQGRIDVSEVYTKWEDIRDRKHPLRSFKAQDKVSVRVLGIHDARNHRFLPITHRGGKVPVFELSAKTQPDASLLSYDQVKVDAWHVAFVNNIMDNALWVNLSPNVRGRIERMEVSEDVSVVSELEANFPIGSAIRVRVKGVDVASGRLDLSAKATSSEETLTLESLSEGMIVTGRVTRVTERSLLVQLGPSLVGQVGHIDLADDFDEANPGKYQKNDVLRACVVGIDRANKRVHLSTRPSKVLSSSLPVKDRPISNVDDLKVSDVVRGFIKSVTDKGIFVSLSHNITAFVPVPELSDSFVKDWKADFEVDRLVAGKVIEVDAASKKTKLSLKDSVVSGNYIPKLGFDDFEKDQIVTGVVRKVEPFGAFVVIDNTNNVSGLAHKSQVAERRVDDVTTLFEAGDRVKAIILKIDAAKHQISLGLKRSYFVSESDEDDEEDDDGSDEEGGVAVDEDMDDDSDEADDDDGGIDVALPDADGGLDVAEFGEDDDDDVDMDAAATSAVRNADDGEGLNVGGFDWTGMLKPRTSTATDTTSTTATRTTTRKPRPTYQEDLTGTLDSQLTTPSDFERHLLTDRNTASTWIAYISHHVSQGSLETARSIAERALTEIHIREQDEKLSVWLAYLGLEIEYGDADSADAIFKRACEYSDAREVHLRAADAFAASGRLEKAEETYNALLKNKEWNRDVQLWLTFARFLFDGAANPDKARGLLARADQVLAGTLANKEMQAKVRRELVMKFAALEFRCKGGDAEKGRNMFEGLVDVYARRWDIWDVYVDMEKHVLLTPTTAAGGKEARDEQVARVRSLYERMTDSRVKMKKRRAAFVFKQWLAWEEKPASDGGAGSGRKQVEHVKARAQECAERLKGQNDD